MKFYKVTKSNQELVSFISELVSTQYVSGNNFKMKKEYLCLS